MGMAGFLWPQFGCCTYFTFTTVPHHECHLTYREAKAQRHTVTCLRSFSGQKRPHHKSFCKLTCSGILVEAGSFCCPTEGTLRCI